jgi:hypothetical protein
VIAHIIVTDELKDRVLVSLIDQLYGNEFEGKLNTAMVLKELIESKKNFSFK